MKLNIANTQMGRTMVLYRAEEFKMLELQRSINVERLTLMETLDRLLKQDPNKQNDPESYFQVLSKSVRRSNILALQDPIIDRARKLLSDFIEARIDPTVKAELTEARKLRDIVNLKRLLGICDQKEYGTPLVKQCSALFDRINRINAEAQIAQRSLEEIPMQVCLKAAEQISYNSELLDYFRRLLFQTPKESFLKEQIKCAAALGDRARSTRLELRMKEMFLAANEQSFQLSTFSKLKSPSDWAAEKFFCLDRDKLAASMLSWSADDIHSSLQDFELCGITELEAEKLDQECQQVFKFVHAFIESTSSSYESAADIMKSGLFLMKSVMYEIPNDISNVALSIVKSGLQNPRIRDEIYVRSISISHPCMFCLSFHSFFFRSFRFI
jgi:hypothetical protein